jgi:DnaK suppressor protein
MRQTGGEAAGSLSNTPLHLADLGTDAFEQEVTMSLLENETQTMAEIAGALTRIEDGTYGHCERCGRDIPTERLNVLPYVRYCVPCARELEAAGVPDTPQTPPLR